MILPQLDPSCQEVSAFDSLRLSYLKYESDGAPENAEPFRLDLDENADDVEEWSKGV